jgi:glycosyltransferase involved in cell wall biosynthesis
MNILFFTRRFYPQIGGVETHVFEVSKRLVSFGHTVIVVCESEDKKDFQEREEYNGIVIYRIPISKRISEKKKKYIIWQWLRKQQLLLVHADIVHCHDVFYWYLPFRFIYPTKPVFTTFHGYEGYPVSKKTIVIRKFSEKLSWGNICAGAFIEKWYGTKANFVTYGGTNSLLDPYLHENEKGRSKNGQRIKIAFIGRLDKDTGIMVYLKALRELQKKKFLFSFIVYGDGKFRKQAEKIGKVYGFISDVEKKIQKVDIVFVSSYLSMLQSLAARKSVFAVYENPLKEDYLRMSPFAKFIIIGNDSERLSAKIIFYAHHQKIAQKMIDAGSSWAKEQTWKSVVDQYITLWDTAIHKKR